MGECTGISASTGCRSQLSRPESAASFILMIWLGALPCGPAHAQNNYNDYLIVRENGVVCADQSQPLAKRIASCAKLIGRGVLEKNVIAKIYLTLGQALQESGDDRAALQDFNAAISSDSKYEQAWLGRAYFYASQSDYVHALEEDARR